MSKESKFYVAVTLIGVCVACAVYFYLNIETEKVVYNEMQTEGVKKIVMNKTNILYMCICIAPIIPLFFFAKNNTSNK